MALFSITGWWDVAVVGAFGDDFGVFWDGC